MNSLFLRLACCLAAMSLAASARGQSYTPYVSDATTLHLWHLDWSVTDSGTVPVALGALGGGATLGNPSATGLGTALSTVDGGAYVSLGTGTDAYLAVGSLVNGAGDNTSTTLVDPTTGAFTFEMVVQFAFDPLSNLSVRNSTSNAEMQLLSGEQDSTGGGVRSFQLRFDPVGFTPGQDGFTTALSAPAIEFISVRNGTSPEYKIVPLPTTGANATVQGAWYHLAVTYTGSAGTAGNLKYYWTKLDGSQSQAALLGTKTLTNSLSTGAVDLAIGNIGRSPSQNNFVGYLDEVRISSAARAATDMMPARYDAGGHVSAAPTALSATAISSTGLSLSWNAVAGATGYNVKRATTNGGPYATVASSDSVLTETYVDAGLTGGVPYYYVVSAVNSTGESANSTQAAATPQPVSFTESFSGGTDSNDTPFNTYTFAPAANENGYTVSRAHTSVFPTDTSTAAGGTALTMGDDVAVAVTLANSVSVPFYGTSYGTFYVGSNGYITFGSGDTTYTQSISNHFAKPRISALYRDLLPATGEVTWRQLTDRVAVTWQGVPQYGSSDLNNFQIEIFTGGTIRITVLAIAATDGIIGLSRGTGTPAGFVANDFSAFPTAFVDTDNDGLPDWWELQYFGNLNQTGSGDPDGDGIDNLHEYLAGTNPTITDNSATDSDGDGLPDAWELKYFGNLNQNASGDYDRDGISNGAEYAAGTDPTNPNSVPGDVDGDGLPDTWEMSNLGTLVYGAYDDPDGDGYNNLAEMIAGTNPLDPNSHPSWISPRVAFLQDSVPDASACLMPSSAPYGRALNGEEFQTPLLTYSGYQYTGWYTTSGSTQTVYLARRTVSGQTVGAWQAFNTGSSFTNGKSSWDAHNVVSIGICPADGTLHMSWDMHDNTMRYRRSVVGLCTTNTAAWGTSGVLGAEQSSLASDTVSYDSDVTYPRFINAPDGTLYLQRRYGITNNGDQLFQKYLSSSGTWTTNTLFSSRAGTYTGVLASGYGTSSARNGYPNGFDFGPDGTIHHTFTYREQADSSNHDINYIYSTDAGVTWRNNAGTVVANTATGGSVNVNSTGIKMKVLDSRQLFINQQSQCVDNDGRVHVLGLHRRAEAAYVWQSGDPTFTVVDTAYYHYFRDPSTGVWSQRQIPPSVYPVGSRPKILYDTAGNVYAVYVSYASNTTNVVPGYGAGKLVVASASKVSQYTDWSIVQVVNGSFTGDPLADQVRLLASNVLSVYIQETSATTSVVGTPLHVYDFVVSPNAAPTLAAVADQTVSYGTTPITLTATVADQDTAVASLTLSGASSNAALVPTANIVFSGSGASRTVTITPASGVSGTATITLTVSDGNSTASRSFNVTVLSQAQTWRLQYFGTTLNSGSAADSADPDGDGVPNLLERAFGGNPTVANRNVLPVIDNTAPLLSITYYRAKAATDLTFTVQESADLVTWTTASGTSTLLSDDGTVQRYRFTAPANSAGKKFLRVQVIAP